LVFLGLLGMLAAAVLSVASAGAVPTGWSRAIEVPGTATLNTDGYAQVTSVSCGAPSVCAAGGWYKDGSGNTQAFVVTEKHGRWGHAIEVPGTAALNSGHDEAATAEVTSISCRAAGECAAGGFYTDASNHYQAFVVTETRGRWGHAIEAPGVAALGSGDDAEVNSVSCGAPGACVAGGDYSGVFHHTQAFVVAETHGRWGKAMRVHGTTALNRGPGDARVNSVSCGAPGECVVGGRYTDRSGNYQAFVESLTNGHWGWAVEVPGTATLNRGKDGRAGAEVVSVSCAGAGACAVGGFYTSGFGSSRAFVVSETHGRWDPAVALPDTVIGPTGDAQVNSVSCAAAGACVAGGRFTDISSDQQAFVVSSKHGRWGHAFAVPGSGHYAAVSSVSCGAAGACVAGGYYHDAYGRQQAFVVSEAHGHWSHAINVPGTRVLNKGDAQVNALSCAAGGPCVAGGTYQDSSQGYQAFVAASAELGYRVTRP
jgi:hypothetical protein